MELNIKNIVLVLSTILGLIGLLGAIYMFFMVNGLLVGTVSSMSNNSSMPVDSAMTTYISTAETGYITNATSLQSKISLAIQIFSIVILLVLFGLGGMFAYDKYNKNKKSGGF